ncbi:heme-binding domain-containing protein [Granulicella sp. dw_53]|uniref:heme-binding domain-containing protein n=1 Tax=Granulicella sp. dw_53 TaxID=2719792 RepID=UPI001BD25848|nr:heme-binding domain-containing protein [Granulicella sp. dw_53]
MSSARSMVIVCTIGIASSLLFARAHPFGDAGLYAQSHSGSILQHTDIPPDARETLLTKCADCHSTQTRSPLYGRFAPVSWLMERDIVEAREAMNLSRWDSYSAEEQQAFKTKILLETKSHHMPLPQYRVIHWNTRITERDINVLTQWARQSQSISVSQAASVTTEGDAARGKDVFERRCTGCHSLDQNREGPRLNGVFGRVSGSVSDFGYSTVIKQAHITWNETTLEKWLTDPDALVPGNNMEFRVAKPQERKDLVRFLEVSN